MFSKMEFDVIEPKRNGRQGVTMDEFVVGVYRRGANRPGFTVTLPSSGMEAARIQAGDRAVIAISKDRTVLCVRRVPKGGFAVSVLSANGKKEREKKTGTYARSVVMTTAEPWMVDRFREAIRVHKDRCTFDGSAIYIPLS